MKIGFTVFEHCLISRELIDDCVAGNPERQRRMQTERRAANGLKLEPLSLLTHQCIVQAVDMYEVPIDSRSLPAILFHDSLKGYLSDSSI